MKTQVNQNPLENFKGKTIRGGFSMTSPTPDGFGEWIQENSQRYGRKLTPRHGSFIAAILVNEGYIRSSLDRTAVVLHFSVFRFRLVF